MSVELLLGFTEAEWRDAARISPVIDAFVRSPAFAGLAAFPRKGSFGQVGVDMLLALAEVSPDFARRLGSHLDDGWPGWRAAVARQVEAGDASDPSRAQWQRLLTIVPTGQQP